MVRLSPLREAVITKKTHPYLLHYTVDFTYGTNDVTSFIECRSSEAIRLGCTAMQPGLGRILTDDPSVGPLGYPLSRNSVEQVYHSRGDSNVSQLEMNIYLGIMKASSRSYPAIAKLTLSYPSSCRRSSKSTTACPYVFRSRNTATSLIWALLQLEQVQESPLCYHWSRSVSTPDWPSSRPQLLAAWTRMISASASSAPRSSRFHKRRSTKTWPDCLGCRYCTPTHSPVEKGQVSLLASLRAV